MPNDWTLSELAMLTQHYPHTDNKQLASLIPTHPIGEIRHKANSLGIFKVHERREAILSLASRPGGMKAAELKDGERGRRACSDMAIRGDLVKVVVSFKNVIYFRTKEAADKWHAATQAPVKLARPLGRAAWPKDTPAYYPPGLKVTVCPSPNLDHRTNRGWGIGGPSLMDQL